VVDATSSEGFLVIFSSFIYFLLWLRALDLMYLTPFQLLSIYVMHFYIVPYRILLSVTAVTPKDKNRPNGKLFSTIIVKLDSMR